MEIIQKSGHGTRTKAAGSARGVRKLKLLLEGTPGCREAGETDMIIRDTLVVGTGSFRRWRTLGSGQRNGLVRRIDRYETAYLLQFRDQSEKDPHGS